jgi:hypothetical protein
MLSLCKHGGVSTKIDYYLHYFYCQLYRSIHILPSTFSTPNLSATGASYDHRQRLFVVRCAKRCRQCMFGLELINDFLKLKSLKPIGRTCGDWTNGVHICSSWSFDRDEVKIMTKMLSLMKSLIIDYKLSVCEYGLCAQIFSRFMCMEKTRTRTRGVLGSRLPRLSRARIIFSLSPRVSHLAFYCLSVQQKLSFCR